MLPLLVSIRNLWDVLEVFKGMTVWAKDREVGVVIVQTILVFVMYPKNARLLVVSTLLALLYKALTAKPFAPFHVPNIEEAVLRATRSGAPFFGNLRPSLVSELVATLNANHIEGADLPGGVVLANAITGAEPTCTDPRRFGVKILSAVKALLHLSFALDRIRFTPLAHPQASPATKTTLTSGRNEVCSAYHALAGINELHISMMNKSMEYVKFKMHGVVHA